MPGRQVVTPLNNPVRDEEQNLLYPFKIIFLGSLPVTGILILANFTPSDVHYIDAPLSRSSS
ncbi:hypothetical protein GCM10023187_26100 [Nibrella viscosa]|uniref:Uncharacterized protein n=1 Tax=Nibrella viscosa TaxID=1084524 RepID=A0ABP8KGA8_9BACT